jgi:hypothetical protein
MIRAFEEVSRPRAARGVFRKYSGRQKNIEADK